MREGIHPNFEKTTITCHCGNVMETMSTKKDIKVEILSLIHISEPTRHVVGSRMPSSA